MKPEPKPRLGSLSMFATKIEIGTRSVCAPTRVPMFRKSLIVSGCTVLDESASSDVEDKEVRSEDTLMAGRHFGDDNDVGCTARTEDGT